MHETLYQKLQDYIRENNPDLLLALQEESRLSDYLREQIASVDSLIEQLLAENKALSLIGELCMAEMTKHLKPSRYNYLLSLLEQEYPAAHEKLLQNGLLTSELINMIAACDPVFDELHFSEENENDPLIYYAITGAVHEYLNRENENG